MHPYASAITPHRGAWLDRALGHGTPLEALAKGLNTRTRRPQAWETGTSQLRKRPEAAGRRWECQQEDAGNRIPHKFYAPVKWGFLGGKPCVRGMPFVPN